MAEYFDFKSSSAFPELPGDLGPAQVLEKNRYDHNGGYLFLKVVVSGYNVFSNATDKQNIICVAYFIKNKYYNDADIENSYLDILWQDYDMSNVNEALNVAKVLARFTEEFISKHYENKPIKKDDFLYLGKKLGLNSSY